jgi:hypothetical protein
MDPKNNTNSTPNDELYATKKRQKEFYKFASLTIPLLPILLRPLHPILLLPQTPLFHLHNILGVTVA